MSDLVTRTGVELLKTGIEYPASTGPFTVTTEMLEETVLSQSDPHIPPPRIKLGHEDSPINDDWEQLVESGEPSAGTVQNMTVSEDGQTLLGDLVGIPSWLDEILESAYPARSIEGGSWKNPANDKEYSFTITALALLGVVWPGCTSLEDLQMLYSEDGPEVSVIEMGAEVQPLPVKAQVNVDNIRRQFYDEFAQGDRYWWWLSQMFLEPNELIVIDDDEDQVYRLPFAISGDTISFKEEIPVKVTYVDQPAKKDGEKASAIGLAPLPNAGKCVAVMSKAESGRHRPEEEVTAMTPEELRQSLGLAEDASDEDVKTKITELRGESPEPDDNDGDDDNDETADQTGDEGTTETPDDTETSGTQTVDEGVLASLQRDAALGRQAREEQLETSREADLEAAIKEGRIPRARKAHYAEMQAKDPDGARTLLRGKVEEGGLAQGLIPVGQEVGGTGDSDLSASEYPSEWLSADEQKRAHGDESRVTIGG